MRVISKRRLKDFWAKHDDAKGPLGRWYQLTLAADWKSLADVRKTFPHADVVRVDSGRSVTVFNVAGTGYRIVSAIHYNTRRVYVLQLLTHEEYDREAWKGGL